MVVNYHQYIQIKTGTNNNHFIFNQINNNKDLIKNMFILLHIMHKIIIHLNQDLLIH